MSLRRTIIADEFCQIIKETTLQKAIPFPFDSDFIKLYFGTKKDRIITYAEFAQFLHDFHNEYATVAFRVKDSGNKGYISVADFYEIMESVKGHLLTEPVSYQSM